MLKWQLLAGVRNAEGVAGGGSGDPAPVAAGSGAADSGAKPDGGAAPAADPGSVPAGDKPAATPAVAVDGSVPAPKAAEGEPKPKAEGEEGKDPDVKDGEEKPKDDDKPAEFKPEDYKFVLPDGAEPDAAQAEQFTKFAVENKVPPELAQKLVDYHAAQMSQQVKAWTDQVAAWGEETKNDPEYGGAEYEQNIAVANRALADFGGPKLGEAARSYGWGNHPEFVRFMVNVGKAMGYASTEKGGGQANTGTAIPLHKALYPNMK